MWELEFVKLQFTLVISVLCKCWWLMVLLHSFLGDAVQKHVNVIIKTPLYSVQEFAFVRSLDSLDVNKGK